MASDRGLARVQRRGAHVPPVAPEPTSVPLAFYFAFAVPTFFVVLWFMVRLFSGRWITEAKPDLLAQIETTTSEQDPRA